MVAACTWRFQQAGRKAGYSRGSGVEGENSGVSDRPIRCRSAEARELAAEARKAVRDGRVPEGARARRTDVPTFGEVADKLIEGKEAGWRNAKHRYQWHQTLGIYAKALRPIPIDRITTDTSLSCPAASLENQDGDSETTAPANRGSSRLRQSAWISAW